MTERKAEGRKSSHKAKGATRSARREGPTKADIESFLDLVALERQPRGVIRVLPGTKVQLRFGDDERRLILGGFPGISGDNRRLWGESDGHLLRSDVKARGRWPTAHG